MVIGLMIMIMIMTMTINAVKQVRRFEVGIHEDSRSTITIAGCCWFFF